MNIFGIAVASIGYAFFYYGTNAIIQSYKRILGPMNPPPLTMVLGLPGTSTKQAVGQNQTGGSAGNFNPGGGLQ